MALRRAARRGPAALRLASLGPQPTPMSLLPAPAGDLSEAARLPVPEAASRPGLIAVIASLGRDFAIPDPSGESSLSGGAIRWIASPDCLAAPLRAVLAEVAARFGPLRVNSTCRSKTHNARVGGAKRSYHLTGDAADFRVSGQIKEIHAFLSGLRVVGGIKHYGFGAFHIDTGPRRTWGSKSSKSRRRKA